MKKLISLLLAAAMCLSLTACGGSSKKPKNEKLVMGFAQIGQESGWRDAETSDIQWYAARHTDTIELHFADGQQKPENQIKAIRNFIDMGVDVIAFAPVDEVPDGRRSWRSAKRPTSPSSWWTGALTPASTTTSTPP